MKNSQNVNSGGKPTAETLKRIQHSADKPSFTIKPERPVTPKK